MPSSRKSGGESLALPYGWSGRRHVRSRSIHDFFNMSEPLTGFPCRLSLAAAVCPKILIIEDEPAIADTLLYALKTEGFDPHWCATGQAGIAALAVQPFALVVLDVGLPDGSGFEFCKTIRSRSSVPVLFLTARTSEIDRVVGLEIGGDDYLVKPFSPRELTARVKAILRRAQGSMVANTASASASPITPAPANTLPAFAVDEVRCKIQFRGVALDLTRYEYRLLKLLASQPGRVFSREQLMDGAWEEPGASLDRTVDAHIKSLRAKLRAVDATTDPIQTHRGLGYSLKE
jgi:two-component system, OmpR family, catabolic regulation response regulator CreB